MKKIWLVLPFVILVSGCGDQKKVPFLGQWNGAFTVEKVKKGPDTPEDRKHNSLRGYISIVLNKNGYTLHLEGEQQKIDVKGVWTYSGNQITFTPKDTKVVTEGGPGGANPNFKYVPEEELYSAYLKKFTLKLSKDGSTLQGLTTTIAFLEGVHSFKKD